ncbi:MAG: SIMPL domain-containing protein [Verrucomicrobia bacterium]|nr:SIMPL domain-containing protein [Verrucomicrobiota bacterium]
MRLLKVQGKGRVSVEPDLVTLSFEVETKAGDYAECLQNLNARAEDLRASMTAAGLDRADLKTSDFSVRVDTQYKDGRHMFVGYRASHNMRIELPVDKELLNRTLRHIARGHSGAEISLVFSVKDSDALRQRVLMEAVRIAKSNAEVLASAAGMSLGKLQQIDYGWVEVRIHNREAGMVCNGPGLVADCDVDIEPEDVTAEDNVTLVYEISD